MHRTATASCVVVTHEFFGMGAVLDDANDAVEFAAQRLRGAFAR